MGSKADRRRQKRAEKKKAKDKDRRRTARDERRASKVRNIEQLADLPEGECYASSDWHEQGPETVWAAFSREHPNGMVAAAIFELNLRDQGIQSADLLPELTPGQLEGELGRRAGDMVISACEPELVVKLVDEARKLSASNDRPLPKTLDDAVALFGDILPEDCDYEILVGDTPTGAATTETKPKGGWMAWIQNRFTGGD
ncbi:MAG: hypothetical protein AAFV53_05910 [Myxococcota bacterium]